MAPQGVPGGRQIRGARRRESSDGSSEGSAVSPACPSRASSPATARSNSPLHPAQETKYPRAGSVVQATDAGLRTRVERRGDEAGLKAECFHIRTDGVRQTTRRVWHEVPGYHDGQARTEPHRRLARVDVFKPLHT